jgi:hypothetical protein
MSPSHNKLYLFPTLARAPNGSTEQRPELVLNLTTTPQLDAQEHQQDLRREKRDGQANLQQDGQSRLLAAALCRTCMMMTGNTGDVRLNVFVHACVCGVEATSVPDTG